MMDTPVSLLCRERLPSGFILFAVGPGLSHTAYVVAARDDVGNTTPAKRLPLVCGKPAGHDDGEHQAAVRWPA